jgi:hypothetical protein
MVLRPTGTSTCTVQLALAYACTMYSMIPAWYAAVEIPGRDVGIPILFVPRILSRESETRKLNSTSPD